MIEKNKKFIYDVALSFAGEQREYVESVADILEKSDVKVFCDKYEKINMWGKNLVDHFKDIYGSQSEFIVMFISKEYTEKAWPNFERQVALSRWIDEKKILLPVRFDDSEIPGLPDSIGYLDLNSMPPEELAKAIMQKIKIKNTVEQFEASDIIDFKLPKKKIRVNPYEERKKFINFVTNELKRRCAKVHELDFYEEDVGDKKQIRILNDSNILYALDIHRKGVGGGSGISFSYGIKNDYLSGYNAWGDFEWDSDRESIVLKLDDFSMLDDLKGNGHNFKLLFNEFVNKLWNKIINLLDEENY